MIKVYIASPYSIGDKLENVERSFRIGNELLNKGFAPYCPLYSHYLHEMESRDYRQWITIDEEWILQCDYLLRLPGESTGADYEVEFAKQHGIHVVYNINDIKWENLNKSSTC